MNRPQRRAITTDKTVSQNLKSLLDKERTNAMAYAVDNYSIAVASTLLDKCSMTPEQLQGAMKEIMRTFDSLNQDRISFNDLRITVREESGVDIEPTSKVLQLKSKF